MEIESILKWTLIAGVAGFGMYIVYQFAVKQGWLSAAYRPRLARMGRR
jgi:uncharacterized membrane-anchored protein